MGSQNDDNNETGFDPKKDYIFHLNYAEEDIVTSEGGFGKDTFITAVDIYENEKFVMVDLEVPGIETEKVSVTIEKDLLTIEGVKKDEPTPGPVTFHCAERNYGWFKRRFGLGQAVDSNSITATCKNGILHICIPKLCDRRNPVRKIEVRDE